MDTEKVVGTALGVAASICLVAFTIMKKVERKEKVSINSNNKQYTPKSSIISNGGVRIGGIYVNWDETMRVHVSNIFEDNSILYSKFDRNTGKYCGTYIMPEKRFISTYYCYL